MTDPLELSAQNERRLRGDLVRGSLWTLLASVVGLPVSFAANLVIVRALGPREFAQLAVLSAAYLVALTVTSAGVAVATTQELALARSSGDVQRCALLIRRCSGFACLVQAPLMAVVVVVALRHGGPVIALVGAAVTAVAILQAPALVVLSGSARNAVAAKAALAMAVLGQSGVAATAAISGDARTTWIARLAALVISPAIALALLEPGERRAVLRPALPWPLDPALRSSALAFWGLSLAGFVLVERTEIFVLQWQAGAVAVAVFALATTVTGQLTGPMDSLVGPLAPTSAGLIAADAARGPRLLRSSLRVSGLAGAVTCAVALPALVVLVPPVFGPAYGRCVTVLVALGAVSCLDSVLTPVRALAFGLRSAPAVLRVTLLGLVVDVGLALALIPRFGLGGAVVALCASQLLFGVLVCRLVLRRLDVPARAVVSSAGVALVGPPAAVVALLVSAPVHQVVLRAVIAAPVGAVLVLTTVRTGRGLRMDGADLQFLVQRLPAPIGGRLARTAVALRLAHPSRTPTAG